jgi:signal peptidase II
LTEEAGRARAPFGPLSLFGIAIVGGIVIVDQLAKWIAEAALPYGEPISVLPILTLFRTYNTGIAFSFLAGLGSAALILLTAAISVVVLLVWWRSREQSRLIAAGYALIVGGALGNLIDRIAHGHVIDFLLLHLEDWTLFVFNLADVALTIGPGLLILIFLFRPQQKGGRP